MDTPRPTLVIVDDDPVGSRLLAASLEREGFATHLLPDGRDARRRIEALKAELVLLDINLPDVQGTEILSDLRSAHSSLDLPVIMCTTREGSDDVVNALALGANDYLVKPIQPEVAAARVRAHLGVKALGREKGERQRLEGVAAMMVTYNHEINSPLTVALGQLSILREMEVDPRLMVPLEKVERSVRRIANIVEQIRLVTRQELNLVTYVGNTKMIKLP